LGLSIDFGHILRAFITETDSFWMVCIRTLPKYAHAFSQRLHWGECSIILKCMEDFDEDGIKRISTCMFTSSEFITKIVHSLVFTVVYL